jgi:broad specificity phosphatase PhoE
LQHGESLLNVKGRIGGDGDLSERGKMYAQSLAEFIRSQNIPNLRVWTSWLKRTIQTAATIDAPQERWKALNEIDAVSVEHSSLLPWMKYSYVMLFVQSDFLFVICRVSARR